MNKYDQVTLNINELLATQEKRGSAWEPTAGSADTLTLLAIIESTLARWSMAALYKTGFLRRLIYANLKLDWFFEFRDYWVKELGLRRLELHDFFFLSGIYRQKFQNLEVTDETNMSAFLASWQAPAALYLVFHYQYKLALHPLSAYTMAKYLPQDARVCEYGCGLAPMTQCLAQYYPHKNLQLTAIDIPSYMLHFVRWKFRQTPFVRVMSLNPENDAPLDTIYNVITCLTVLEHVPRPLALIHHLYNQLAPGGLLMFDYIKSEGSGLDTKAALTERDQVLNFIRRNFTTVYGTIPAENSHVAAVICRKK